MYSSSLHASVFRLGVSFFPFRVGFCLVFFWLLSPFFSSLEVVFLVSLSVVFGCASLAKVVLVSAQGSFFKTTLGLSFSLIVVSFSVFHFNIPRFFFFMSPTFELTLSFCFSGVLFLAPLHSSFLIRSFHPVGSHLLLQSTLLSFFVFSLFYSSSLDATFFKGAWLTLPSCFFLLVLVWGCFSLLLFPFFLSLGLFCLVSLSGVFGGPTPAKLDFFLWGI